MPSRMWSRQDLRNILLAIYAAKFPRPPQPASDQDGAGGDESLYRWGFRTAIQALLLACGSPLQLLDQALQRPAPVTTDDQSTQLWWIEDLENLVAAVYRSAISASLHDLDEPALREYRRGFGEVITAFLEAIGSRQEPHRWYEQVQADRYWVITGESHEAEEMPPKMVGSPPPEQVSAEPSD